MKLATKKLDRTSPGRNGLAKARKAIAALQPGDSWAADHPIDFEEFNRLTPVATHAELFEGVISMPSPDLSHELVFSFLLRLLGDYVEAKGLGHVLGSRTGVRIDAHSVPQPDLVFVRKSRRHIIKPLEIVEAPDLIMEIAFSKSSRRRAHSRMLRYQQLGVPELWYIDLPGKVLRISQRTRGGRYSVLFEGSRGLAESKCVSGFSIRAEWLWSKPGKFPSVFSIVQKLLKK